MTRICTQCQSNERYYAKGLCTCCYQKQARLANPERYKEADRKRWLKPERQAWDKARHYKHKEKRNQLSRDYRARNLPALKEFDKNRWATDPKRRQAHTEYAQNNREHIRALNRQRYRRDPAKWFAGAHDRRNAVKKASLKLSPENKKALYSFFRNQPQDTHVDHIIPLRGEHVSGLNVPWNLQYLTPEENLTKKNRFDFTYENESWRALLESNVKNLRPQPVLSGRERRDPSTAA